MVAAIAVNEGGRREVDDEGTVALSFDDIDQPVLQFLRRLRVEGTVDVRDHLPEGGMDRSSPWAPV